MKKPNQKNFIISKLLSQGYITRNQCLDENITRLSGYIKELRYEGWEFDARHGTKNKMDYGYIVKVCPLKRTIYTVDNKQIITHSK